MDTYPIQIISSLPIGITILIVLAILKQKLNDLCHKIDRIDQILIDHITHHSHCPGPEDDEEDEEEEE
jgi:hypothetical protein